MQLLRSEWSDPHGQPELLDAVLVELAGSETVIDGGGWLKQRGYHPGFRV